MGPSKDSSSVKRMFIGNFMVTRSRSRWKYINSWISARLARGRMYCQKI